MKRSAMLILMAGVLLTSCAPGLLMRPDPDGGGFNPLGSPPVLWFHAGKTDVLNLILTISGENLRVNAPTWCKANGADILCMVPTLPAGKNFVLPMRGSNISAVATYKRLSGISYNSTVRQ